MAVVVPSPRQAAQWGSEVLAWVNIQEPNLKGLWIPMLRAGNVGFMTRFLDVGCETGGALMLARGLGAAIAGIDPREDLADFAQDRTRHGDIRVGPIDRLPFVDDCGTFVVSTHLITNPTDGLPMLGEMCRVCAPNGKICVAVWGEPDRCDQAGIFQALETPDPFRYADNAALDRLVDGACGRLISRQETECVWEYPSVEAAWIVQRQAGWCAEANRTAFLGAIRPFAGPDGRVKMRNCFRYVILHKV